jgi:hypothetical protein
VEGIDKRSTLSIQLLSTPQPGGKGQSIETVSWSI